MTFSVIFIFWNIQTELLFNNPSPIDFLVVQILSALNLYRFILITESTGKHTFLGIIELQYYFVIVLIVASVLEFL